jgi:hypothetical protein
LEKEKILSSAMARNECPVVVITAAGNRYNTNPV